MCCCLLMVRQSSAFSKRRGARPLCPKRRLLLSNPCDIVCHIKWTTFSSKSFWTYLAVSLKNVSLRRGVSLVSRHSCTTHQISSGDLFECGPVPRRPFFCSALELAFRRLGSISRASFLDDGLFRFEQAGLEYLGVPAHANLL